ncbi:MAG: YfjI family protein [Ruminococcus flavefaciens]|nr:YfjI family protein [Ruminococcus flavefaciens]MCM1231368.1 YfjI family protein [Ruminococcus flavefaciens]
MNQESEETKEYKAPDMLKALEQAFMQKLECGDFLPYDSFLSNLANFQRIIFDTEDLQERSKFYTYVMNNARAVDYAQATEKAFKSETSRLGIPELWEIPKEFEKEKLSVPFPIDSLPPLLRDYLKAVADNVQVDVTMCILPLLSVLSRCVQGKFTVCFPNTYHEEHLNLYTLTVARPGERKSGVFGTLTAPLFEYQKNENERLAPLIAEYRAKRKSLANTFESLTKGKNPDMDRAQEIALELENLKPVNRLTLNITDCTPESLTAELADNNELMGMLDDECGIFEILAGLYSKGTPNIDIFLKAYDGSPLVVTRRSKENIYLEHPVITLGLMAQPEPFAKAMNKPEFSGRGLIHRFLFAFPESRQGSRKQQSPLIPKKLREEYNNLINYLLKTGAVEEPRTMVFATEAKNIMRDYFDRIEDRLKPNGELVYMAEWANKLYAKCCRIAGILHLCTHKPQELITANTAFRAIKIAEWAESQAHRAFGGTAFEDEATRNAKRILKKLKEKKQDVYTRSDIARDNRTIKSNELDEVLELLDDMKCIRITEEKTAGRPKITIKVNPLLFDK